MLRLYLLGHNCLYLTFKPYLSSETYSRNYEKLPNIVIYACKNNTENWISWKCVARKFGFVYLRFDPLRRKIAWLQSIQQLTLWCRGSASALSARGHGFNSRHSKGFYVWFCVVFLCVFLRSKNTLFFTKFYNFFCNINSFSILYILQDLWQIIRV